MVIAASLVRRTAIVGLFLAALAILLIAPGAISAETGSEGATEEAVWSADMFVVEYTSISIGAASADLFSNIGGSGDLKIKSLWSHVPSRDIRLAFQEGVPDADDLTLIVGELTLEFPPGSSGNSSFKWTNVDIDWEDGETIPVSIVQTSAPEAPEEEEEPAANNPATGTPTISGTAQVGQTLTVDTSGIADADGLTDASFGGNWFANDTEGIYATITGGYARAFIVRGADLSYTVSRRDVGKTVKIQVYFTDDAGNDEWLTSAKTSAVAATTPGAPESLVASPTSSGDLSLSWEAPTWDISGEILGDQTWGDGGSPITGYVAQWKEASDSWDTESDVSEATVTGTTHTIQALASGTEYTTRVIAVNSVGRGTPSYEATVTTNSPATGAPTISGTAQVGQTLTASTSGISDADGLTNVTYSYQWMADDVNIDGATGSTYVLANGDAGKTIKVSVSFTDDRDNAETLTSEATVSVATAPNRPATGAPTITGTPQVDHTLTAGISDIADEDGLANVSYSYQWISGGSEIDGATGSSYTLTSSELGKTVKVRVTFTDDADNAESLTSVATTAVTRPPPQAPEMDGISIHDGMLRVSGGRVQLSDSSVPAADVGSYISSFKVQWKSGSQEYDATRQAVLAPEPVTANVAYYAFMPAHDIAGLTNDVEYTVRVMATNAGGDGSPSQEQTATPGTKSEQLRQYIEDEIVEEHEASHPWLRQTWNYLQNNNIPLNVWNSEEWPKSTYFDNSSGIGARYVRSLNFSEVTVGAAEAEKKETILINLAHIYTMTNGVSSSPAPLGIAHVYFRTVDTLSLSGCWDSRLYLDVVLSLVTHDSLAGAGDWNRCVARSEDATAMAVVRSALSGQTPDWFADTYHDSDGNPDLEQFWVGVQLVDSEVVAYQLRNSFGGYCDADPNWGLRITRSLNRSLASAGFDTLVNPWRDGGCVPSAPISLTANLEGDGAASVSWEAPESNGGSLLSGYRIQWQSVDAEEGTTPQTKHVYFDDYSDEARPTEVSETIEGLTDGVEYTVRVLAHNPNGDGTAAEVTVPEPNAAPTGVPEISGTPQVDQTLHVAAPDPEAYVTVVITSSDDTVSWSDPDECTSDYNTYLKVTSGPGSGTKTRTHIGSVASGSTEATQTIAYSWTSDSSRPSGVELELYCGTFDAISRQNVLIASTYLARRYRALREGTYSSAPLTALSISSGTLVPAFDRGIGRYTAEVANDVEVITLDPTVLTGYQTDFVRNPIWGVVAVCGRGCSYGYGNGATTGIVLADADEETEGFQISLNRGENRLGIGVNKGNNVAAGPGRLYYLTVTVANSPATGQPTISGTAQVGQTLTVDTSGISDADGLDNVTYSYQWLSSRDTGIDGATSSTYTFQSSDNGKLIKVRVTFTDDAGYDESLTSEATVAVTATVPSAPQSLTVTSGSEIQELDVSWQAPSSNGGSDVTGYKVQWKESTDRWDTAADVSEATEIGTTHTITSLTGGVEYAVRVIATNVAGDGPASTEARATPTDSPTSGEEGTETVESDSTAAWTATLTVGVSGSGSETVWGYSWFLDGMGTLDGRTYNEGDQTIEVMAILLSNGFVAFNVRPHPSVDFVLTVDGTQFASADASEVKSRTLISYVWATTLDWAEDDRVALSLTLKGTDSAEQSEPAENTPATGLPTISGTPQAGQTLTANTTGISDADGLDNVDYSYQWIGSNGNSDTDLQDATDSTYTPSVSDVGNTIKVKVSFTDDRNNAEARTSLATTAVLATVPTQPLSLTVATGDEIQELDASWQVPSSNGGSAVTGYKVQWKEAADSWDTAADVSQATETGTTYTITSLTGGVEYAVRVIATNDVGDGPASTEAKGTPAGGVSEQGVEPENSAPTGLPGIGGTPQVDQTLTASTSNIDDEDGLENVSYGYQWIAGGTDIDGATGSTYTLTASEQGQTVQVRVTFTDDADNEETLTSEATVAVAAAAPAPLTAAFQDLPDSHDGSTTFTFRVLFSEDVGISYVNMRDDAFSLSEGDVTGARRVDGRNDLWEITVEPDDNSDVGITLPANRSCTTTGAICTREDSPRQLTNSPTATVTGPAEAPPANTSAAGAPTISGTPQVEQTLTADTSSITDEDGLTNVSYSYQWMAGGSDIAGATGSTYTLTYSEQGQTIQVRVTFTDDAGNEETLTSEATVAVTAAPNREATGKPTIGGTPQVDQTLTADTTPIDDADGLTNATFEYQWVAGGTDIDGATGSSHTVTSSEQGKTIQVKVTFTDDRDNAEALTSIATAAVAAAPEPLTVRLKVAAPTSHDGSSEFTFEIEFSEEFGISYATLRDHAFTVTGGSVETAQRTDKPSNIPWLITVKPQGTGDVTIELPATTDCDTEGAICTSDGRMLSNEVKLTVTGPDAANSRDTTAPTISSVAMTSDPDENDADLGAYIAGRSGGSIVQSTNWASGVYRIGDDVQVTVTFSENVTVTGSPQLELAIGSNSRTAGYESTDGSAVVFSYTVAVGDSDSDGIAVAANKLTLNGGSVKDAANNDADLSHNALTAQAGHEVDGVRPRLKLTVSDRLKFGASSGGTDGAYTTGEELIIRVAFTEGGVRGSVTGPPRVALNFDGGGPRVAKWDPSLIFNPTQYPLVRFFSYVVQEGDLDSDGPTIGANAIDLAGGFIRDAAGNDAVLTHSAVAASSSFIVDAVAPTVSSIAITSDPGSDDTYGTGDKIEVTVTFSENMNLPGSITCSPDVVHCEAELELDIGGTARTADYQSHTGADVVYAYTVQAGDTDDNGISIGANKLTGQRIRDAAGRFGYGINDADLSHDAVADDSGHKVSGTS